MSLKPLEVRVPITELPTLVEKKSKQTDLNNTPEPMSLPINDISYSNLRFDQARIQVMVKSKILFKSSHFRNPPFFTPLLHQFSVFCYHFITISKQNWKLFCFLCLNWIWIGVMQMFSLKSKYLNILHKDILHNYWILFLTRFSMSELELETVECSKLLKDSKKYHTLS